ncbi:MAG: hypothetical protein KC503_18545 [Myxococcales bacterium]|nr:hypothetical protein [Myxococcales bacterium]
MLRRGALGALVALLLVGCADDAVPPTVGVQVTSDAATCGGDVAPGRLVDLGATTLRLTLMQRDTVGAEPRLVCDERAEIASAAARFDLRVEPGAGRLDLRVEAFDDAGQLLAAATLVDLQAAPRLRDLGVVLARAARFSCTPGALGFARAFHSATALPNGELLLVGGVANRADGRLFVTSTIEVYEPRTGTFRALVGDRPDGRAFHDAILLDGPSEGPYDLLLVGGVTVDPSAPGLPTLVRGGADDALPLLPGDGGRAADSVLLRYYPDADPPQAQVLRASPALGARAFHASAVVGQRRVVIGGLAAISGGRLSTIDELAVLDTTNQTSHGGPFALARARVGAAAAAIDARTVLVFGGNLDSAQGAEANEAIELVNLDEATPAGSIAQLEPGSLGRVSARAHATLDVLSGAGGARELLLVGGLRVEAGAAREVESTRTIAGLSQVGDVVRVVDIDAAALTPVAYHRTVALDDETLLIIGGSPGAARCSDSAALCGSTAVRRYNRTAGLAAAPELRDARFGHSATLLSDGTVVVVGGFDVQQGGAQPGQLVARTSAEVLWGGAQDPFGRAPAAVSDTRCGR